MRAPPRGVEKQSGDVTPLHTMRAPPKREGMRTDGVMAATEVLHNEPRQGSEQMDCQCITQGETEHKPVRTQEQQQQQPQQRN